MSKSRVLCYTWKNRKWFFNSILKPYWTESFTIPLYCDNVSRATKTLIHYILFDRDVFGEFYRDQQQLRDLIEQLYLPIMEDYFTAYADSINEIDQKEQFFTQFLRFIFRQDY